jgi:hypothetical protein
MMKKILKQKFVVTATRLPTSQQMRRPEIYW